MPQHGSLPPWDCRICGIENNWGYKTRCRNCTALPPLDHRILQKGSSKGGAGGGKGGGKGNGKGKGTAAASSTTPTIGSYAFRQIQRAKTDERAASSSQTSAKTSKELQEAKKRADALSAANRKLQKELAEAKSTSTPAGDDDMEWEGPEELDEEGRKARIDKIRGSLPYLEEHFGVESEIYLDAQHEMEVHQRAIRESKPYKTHRTIVERRVEKLRRLQERDNNRLAELTEMAEDIEGKITATVSTMAERGKELDTAEAELRELLLKAVGEEQTTAAPPDPQQGWDTVVGTVASLVRQPGVPPQFTSQLENLFGQLRGMVEQLQQHAAATAATHHSSTSTSASASSSSISPLAASSLPAATAAALPPLSESSEELRRRQRRARQQQRQTAAIAEFEENYRAQLQAKHLDGTSVTEPVTGQPSSGTLQTSSTGPAASAPISPLAPATPVAPASAAESSENGVANGIADSGRPTVAEAPTQHELKTNGPPPSATGQFQAAAPVPAADIEPALESCLSELDNESDITGTMSADDQGEKMDIDKVVSAIPKEQRDGVRAMLEKSKARRMRQLQRRVKKPAMDEPALPRNPKK